MIIFLALILIFLVILIGGERGAMSIMTLAGNIVILFFSIMLMSAGFPVLLLILVAGAGVCYISLFYHLSVISSRLPSQGRPFGAYKCRI